MTGEDAGHLKQRQLFVADHPQAAAMNLENLKKILADNRDTAFGRAHGFAQIQDVRDYRERVPLSDYEVFRPYVDAMLAGKSDQLCIYPIVSYCCTSGTIGEAKNIPVSAEALRRYGNGFEDYQDDLQDKIGGKRLFINTFRTDPKAPIEQTLLFSEIYYRYLKEEGLLDLSRYAGGEETLFIRDPGERLYTKLRIALCREDLTILETVFLYDGLIFFTYLEHHWQEVLEEIEQGRISEERRLPDSVRRYLAGLTVSKERIDAIRRAFESGSSGIAKRLWPKLSLMSGISSRSFETEDRALKDYLGDVDLYYLCYCASECYIGAPVDANDFGYYLLPRNGFFEFLPCGEEASKDALLPEELIIGERYEVVVTNFSGLYRYCMGDIVRVVGFDAQTPILEFETRRSLSLNIAGEKMGASLVEKAVNALRDKDLAVSEWSIGIWRGQVPGRYVLAAVPAFGDQTSAWNTSAGTHQGYAEAARRAEDALDALFTACNPDYADLRGIHYIEKPRVLFMGQEDYARFCDEAGLSTGHRKPKHVAAAGFDDGLCERWVERYGK